MINQLSVVILVDVEAALNARSLNGNVYCVDTNGGSTFTTEVLDNQIVNWLVSGIDWASPTYFAYVSDIKGKAVDEHVLFPTLYDSPSFVGRGNWWGGMVVAQKPSIYEYTMVIGLGKDVFMDLTLYLDVHKGFVMEEPVIPTPVTAS